jgi:hypothetical protein
MDAPSARIVASAASVLSVVDSEGRVLSVRRPDALDRLSLFKVLGAELSLNTPYLGMALLASSVTAIAGVPVPPPVTEEQLESLVRRLGDAGIGAVATALDDSDREEPGGADLGN